VSTVVVTGGAGFVGSHVAELVRDRGHEVTVVDDLSSGKRENVPEGCRLVEVDITDAPAVERAIDGAAFVCHLAAQASVTVSVKEPDRDLAINVAGTLNVCTAAAAAGAPVVFASTGGALYGDNAPIPTPEGSPTEPLAPYGASKLAGEAYVGTWSRLHDAGNVVLRLGNVYGPRQSFDGEAGVVAIFSHCLLHGQPPTVYGDGMQTRDYVYVGDVARAFLLAGESRRAGTYNVGTGIGSSVLELLDSLERAAGVSVERKSEPLRKGELRASALDSSRIRDELGWEPAVRLDEGLAQTFAWYRASDPA
jgi:UDP-glucose 4-epimerase